MWTQQKASDAFTLYVSEKGEDYRIAPNFTLAEAQCKDGSDLVLLHPAAVDLAQHLRDLYGPIRISSWYRSPDHNERVGGIPTSKHLLGMAFDWYPLERNIEEVQKEVRRMEIGGVGIYEGFTHCDVWGVGRRWHG